MQPRVASNAKQPPDRAVPQIATEPPRVQQRRRERLRGQIRRQLRVTCPARQERDDDPLMPAINLAKRLRLSVDSS